MAANKQNIDIPLENIEVTVIKGVGGRLASVLAKLGIENIQDLLFHLPIRYLDRTRVVPIAHLTQNVHAVIQGRVLNSQVAFGRRRSLVVTLEDDSGTIRLRFFHFNAAQKNKLEEGTPLRCYGEPRLGSTGLELYHPEYDYIDDIHSSPEETSLTPIYGLTEGISQQRLRKVVDAGVEVLKNHAPRELLPLEINKTFGVTSLREALEFAHFPPPNVAVDALIEGDHPTLQRLAFEELLSHYLVRRQIRERTQSEAAAVILPHEDNIRNFLATLPFSLTSAQLRVFKEIQKDFRQGAPMLRMVQGDVGSGKTLVAALSALETASSGLQVAVVAPTEILAEQHFKNFSQWLTPLGFKVVWLAGNMGAKLRRENLQAITDGSAAIAVGTHALFQERVEFASLGLAVIDEQHRFGVEQRLTLRKKSAAGHIPHQLIMTATPIPRTLAMTAYSELDYSVIDELPPGRTPINTALISQKRRAEIIARVKSACAQGKQVYWVCPLVEDSESLSAANAEETAEVLTEALAPLPVGLVHGRMKSAHKEEVMQAFKSGQTTLLVATTVIEVGVDVPNASLMIIENPERLGLAQLHQLRGRVGRGTEASHCVLLYGDKLSEQARERLKVLRESNDGFVIAEKDLQLRGPGELLGTRQTGDMTYRLANIERDAHMLDSIHELGDQFMMEDRDTVERLIKRWFGKNRNYAQV